MHWRCIAKYGGILVYLLQNGVTLCHTRSQQYVWPLQRCKHMDNAILGYVRCSETCV